MPSFLTLIFNHLKLFQCWNMTWCSSPTNCSVWISWKLSKKCLDQDFFFLEHSVLSSLWADIWRHLCYQSDISFSENTVMTMFAQIFHSLASALCQEKCSFQAAQLLLVSHDVEINRQQCSTGTVRDLPLMTQCRKTHSDYSPSGCWGISPLQINFARICWRWA